MTAMAGVYIPILVHFMAVVALAGGILGLGWWVGVKRPSKVKLYPYECGMPPVAMPAEAFPSAFI